jgi:hypothetical protein
MNPAINCEPLSERTTRGIPWCFQTSIRYRQAVPSAVIVVCIGMKCTSYAVDNVRNCIIAMGLRQFNYEVNAVCVPWFCRCLRGVELTEGLSVLQLCPVTQIAGFDVDVM